MTMSNARRKLRDERAGKEPFQHRRILHRVQLVSHETNGQPGLTIHAPAVGLEDLRNMLVLCLDNVERELARKLGRKMILPSGLPSDITGKIAQAQASQ